MSWQEIRDRTRLWCKIDPERCLIEIKHRGIIKVIDLSAYGLVYLGLSGDAAQERAPSSSQSQ
jgi:hypothetical protein